jgi:hypothetical protein
LVGDLWDEVRDGTFVWHAPSPEEKKVQKARRQRLLEGSSVPWILQDLAGILQFYDDAQDIMAFTRWNKQLLSPARLRACVAKQAKQGITGAAAITKCFCALGGGGHKKDAAAASSPSILSAGLPAALAFRFLPKFGPLTWLMLAGQVSLTLFGVGVKLGPLIGASIELTFRGLESLGLPFGPEHNKYNELLSARLLEKAEKGIGASGYMGSGDRLAALYATRFAYGTASGIMPHIVLPQDVPNFGDFLHEEFDNIRNLFAGDGQAAGEIVRDAWDCLKSLGSLAANTAGNVLPYLMNDVVAPILGDQAVLHGGSLASGINGLSPEQKAALHLQHARRCPVEGACSEAVEDGIKMAAWQVRGKAGRFRTPGGLARFDGPHRGVFRDPDAPRL